MSHYQASSLKTQVIDSLADVAPAAWNALVQEDYPFLRHEFLWALESQQCLGERTGWFPQHILCLSGDRHTQLVGALPLYLKTNSYGEFVFDWGWADAYQRIGLAYYPKLVNAVPFTPATGPRLLLAAHGQQAAISEALVQRMLDLAAALDCSSCHCLFTNQEDLQRLTSAGFMTRLGCHYHWHNPGYQDFADFIAALSSKKRKNIKRERRLVQEADLRLRTITGAEVSEAEWHTFFSFYSNTFYDRGRHPPLTLGFFQQLSVTLGEQVILVIANNGQRDVAGAISFKSANALFGRHWGCQAEYNSLHFECCYYQGIDYCIQQGLQRFEPGVQGEHKVWRGFLPTLTYSAHWLAHPEFSAAVADFLRREAPAVREHARILNTHSPFREDAQP